MFRRIEATLPADPSYPADLKALGYFINKTGHVRKIAHPEESFQFHLTNEQRHNEVHREAMQECQRQEVLARLAKLGIAPLYLSDFRDEITVTKPENKPHVPILCPPLEVLNVSKRVILIINDSLQDLGILAYRELQRELGLNGGSMVNFAKEIIKRSIPEAEAVDLFSDNAGVADVAKYVPALIVTNTGQRYYSHKHGRAMTLRSWSAMPRKSMCHDAPQIDDVENTVAGHRTAKDHIKEVFSQIINNDEIVSVEAEIYVIGIENGGQHLLEVLDECNGTPEYHQYTSRIKALALIQTGCSSEQFSNTLLKKFLRKRAREWKVAFTEEPNICVEDPRPNDNQSVTEDPESISSDSPGETEPGAMNWLLRMKYPQIRLAGRCVYPQRWEPIVRESGDVGPLCPAFSGGATGIGECIFPNPAVYTSILNFFEEVTLHDSTHLGPFANPKFKVHLPPSEEEMERKALLPPEMSPEQQDIEDKKADIEHMKQSLEATPDTKMFQQGRANVERRIQQAEKDLDDMIKAEQASRDLKPTEGEEARSDWQAVGNGPKVAFAGTMVDADLLKGAGLLETTEGMAKIGA